MRVYLPATLAMIQELTTAGGGSEFVPLSGTGFAVTPALREAYTSGDDEELGEVALREAARASLRLLSADESDLPARRVVVVADADATVRPDLDDAVVRLPGGVSAADIVAVHVDGAAAEAAVRAAVHAVDAADLGDEDAELAVGDVEDHDLGWYATQELPFLLDLL
ncbi:hypothetical protein L5G28_06990 [Gordonia sp. HY285]|uniref:DUF6912 family protein n=1 Tax=Gordonia liuliyuniae TaxID=2911517 RepID=UPI001F2DDE27|nr:hypothetical protein [Gordonia liuliyuniae]MCF8609908.1 hypothetical protein [Gordonia liuliyuniae]